MNLNSRKLFDAYWSTEFRDMNFMHLCILSLNVIVNNCIKSVLKYTFYNHRLKNGNALLVKILIIKVIYIYYLLFLNRHFDPRLIKSLHCWIVFTLLPFVKIHFTHLNRNFTIEMNNLRNLSWRFKLYGLRHLIVRLQFNVFETNLYDWKVLNAIQQRFDAIVFR